MQFRNSTLCFLLFLTFYLFSCSSDDTNIVSAPDEMTFTSKGSPYHITDSLVIDSTMKMIVLPGTEFIFHDRARIIVYGSIEMRGEEDDEIILRPEQEDSLWGGIYLKEPKDTCRFEHVSVRNGLMWGRKVDLIVNDYTFENTYPLKKFDAIIRLVRGSLQLRNSYFKSNQSGEGILLHNQEDKLVLVEGCEFHKVNDAIEFMRSFNNGYILKNKIYSVNVFLGDGIDLNGCIGVIIEDNVIENIHDAGIEIGNDNYGPSENIYSGNNTFINCGVGITVKGGSNALIMNNTFYKNTTGVMAMLDEFISNDDPNRVKIVNSIFYSSRENDFVSNENSSFDIEYSMSNKQVLPGKSNILATPKFENEKAKNFRLTVDSPGYEAARFGSHKRKYKATKRIGTLRIRQ